MILYFVDVIMKLNEIVGIMQCNRQHFNNNHNNIKSATRQPEQFDTIAVRQYSSNMESGSNSSSNSNNSSSSTSAISCASNNSMDKVTMQPPTQFQLQQLQEFYRQKLLLQLRMQQQQRLQQHLLQQQQHPENNYSHLREGPASPSVLFGCNQQYRRQLKLQQRLCKQQFINKIKQNSNSINVINNNNGSLNNNDNNNNNNHNHDSHLQQHYDINKNSGNNSCLQQHSNSNNNNNDFLHRLSAIKRIHLMNDVANNNRQQFENSYIGGCNVAEQGETLPGCGMTEFPKRNNFNNKTHHFSSPTFTSTTTTTTATAATHQATRHYHHQQQQQQQQDNINQTLTTNYQQHCHYQKQPQQQQPPLIPQQQQQQHLLQKYNRDIQEHFKLNQQLQEQFFIAENLQQKKPPSATASTNVSATSSPQRNYRKPFNSPNNSPLIYNNTNGNKTNLNQPLQQQQQHCRTSSTLPINNNSINSNIVNNYPTFNNNNLCFTPQRRSITPQQQYQQYLCDLLAQQQHLQRQQQQLLLQQSQSIKKKRRKKKSEVEKEEENNNNDKDKNVKNRTIIEKDKNGGRVGDDVYDNDESNEADYDDLLSEESLKHNVAIVLNNLDRYNRALRSIILSEQVSGGIITCGTFYPEHNNNINHNCNNNSGKDFNNRKNYYNSDSRRCKRLEEEVDEEKEEEEEKFNIDLDFDLKIPSNSRNSKLLHQIIDNSNQSNKRKMATTLASADYNSNSTVIANDNNNTQGQQTIAGKGASSLLTSLSTTTVGAIRETNSIPTSLQLLLEANNSNILTSLSDELAVSNNANNLTNCSTVSSHDFTHDNSDYQWFLDYGYRDGSSGLQRSVLSSLSGSGYHGTSGNGGRSGQMDLMYDDLAKNIDANLAEVDMENFRTEDIHMLLAQLPSYCRSLNAGTAGGFMFNNRLQQNLLITQQQQQNNMLNSQQQQQQYRNSSYYQQHYRQQPTNDYGQQQNQQYIINQNNTTTSQLSLNSTNCDLIDNSICKSELLFSPIKESPNKILDDSLDMDAYPDDGDIILTCKANKDNYTIAFEGSMAYSDDSYYIGGDSSSLNEVTNAKNKQNFINLHSNLDDIVQPKSLELSMSRSEQFQSPSRNHQHYPNQHQNAKLKQYLQTNLITPSTSETNATELPLKRYPSGNNNTNTIEMITIVRPPSMFDPHYGGMRRCSSLPNLNGKYDPKSDKNVLNPSAQSRRPNQIMSNDISNNQEAQHQQQLNVSQAISIFSMAECGNLNGGRKSRNLLPMCQLPMSSCTSMVASVDDESRQQRKLMHLNEDITSCRERHNTAERSNRRQRRCNCGPNSNNNNTTLTTTPTTEKEDALNDTGATVFTSPVSSLGHTNKSTHVSGSASSNGCSTNPSFNLVKLFIKQKSNNSNSNNYNNNNCMEVGSEPPTSMDVSSGCWPSSTGGNMSSGEGTASMQVSADDISPNAMNSDNDHIAVKDEHLSAKLAAATSSPLSSTLPSNEISNKKSMHDSGKGSAVSRNNEEQFNDTQRYSSTSSSASSSNPFHTKATTLNRNKGTATKFISTKQQEQCLMTAIANPALNRVIKENAKLMNVASSSGDGSSQVSSNHSSTEEPLTQIYNTKENSKDNNHNHNHNQKDFQEDSDGETRTQLVSVTSPTEQNRKTVVENLNSEMITRSMQTSVNSLSSRSSLTLDRRRYRCVPPSFLEKLNNLGEEKQAPIYVIYPNYALPDLAFIKKTTINPEMIFSPFNYKNTANGIGSAADGFNRLGKTNDDLLKNIDYKHVVDWPSLITLLPSEYRHRLKQIPQVSALITKKLEEELAQKPLFCRSIQTLKRTHRNHQLCDCATQYLQNGPQTEVTIDGGADIESATVVAGGGGSSSSGSSQQPSSGYRGSSSLLLTDSEFMATNEFAANEVGQSAGITVKLNNLYNRMDSGVEEMSPSVQNQSKKSQQTLFSYVPQIQQPKGILRKTSSTSGVKRNSMIEQLTTAATTNGNHLSKLEKRRSLQENVGELSTAGYPCNFNQLCSDRKHQPHQTNQIPEVFEDAVENVEMKSKHKRPISVCDYRSERLSRKEIDARMRAENFLTSLPRNELKHYAEIAAILEEQDYFNENEDPHLQKVYYLQQQQEPEQKYDVAALKKQVSRALTQQKKVSFHDLHFNDQQQQCVQLANDLINQRPLKGNGKQRFSTPPNSPNLSMANNHLVKGTAAVGHNASHLASGTITHALTAFRNLRQEESEKQKVDNNRFKRLQIQWELMSKDSAMIKELARVQQTKSGACTPISVAKDVLNINGNNNLSNRNQQTPYTSHSAHKSRIPRPVSYPSGRPVTRSKSLPNRSLIPIRTEKSQLPMAKFNQRPLPSAIISPQMLRVMQQHGNVVTKKGGAVRSPSRLVPPKRYTLSGALPSTATVANGVRTTPTTPTTPSPVRAVNSQGGMLANGAEVRPGTAPFSRARTPNSRIAVTAPNTPKRTIPTARTMVKGR